MPILGRMVYRKYKLFFHLIRRKSDVKYFVECDRRRNFIERCQVLSEENKKENKIILYTVLHPIL